MKKFECEDCGPIDYYLMDGYAFGDRLLEGVLFKVFFNETDELCVKPDALDGGYLKQLNEKHWMKQALEYAERNDIGECPECGNDVCVEIEDIE